MENLKRIKVDIWLLTLAYVALIFHAFIPHHHHIDDRQIVVGASASCHGSEHSHSILEISKNGGSGALTDDPDHASGAHLPGACSTIQHSLSSLSTSYDSLDLLNDRDVLPFLGIVFENFLLSLIVINSSFHYPIPTDEILVENLRYSLPAFRGPPSIIS